MGGRCARQHDSFSRSCGLSWPSLSAPLAPGPEAVLSEKEQLEEDPAAELLGPAPALPESRGVPRAVRAALRCSPTCLPGPSLWPVRLRTLSAAWSELRRAWLQKKEDERRWGGLVRGSGPSVVKRVAVPA